MRTGTERHDPCSSAKVYQSQQDAWRAAIVRFSVVAHVMPTALEWCTEPKTLTRL